MERLGDRPLLERGCSEPDRSERDGLERDGLERDGLDPDVSVAENSEDALLDRLRRRRPDDCSAPPSVENREDGDVSISCPYRFLAPAAPDERVLEAEDRDAFASLAERRVELPALLPCVYRRPLVPCSDPLFASAKRSDDLLVDRPP